MSTYLSRREFLIQRVEELRQLRDGWYGQGSIAPTKDVLLALDQIIPEIISSNNKIVIAPYGDGSIFLEWDCPSSFNNVFIEPDQKMYMNVDPRSEDSSEEMEYEGNLDLYLLRQFIEANSWEA